MPVYVDSRWWTLVELLADEYDCQIWKALSFDGRWDELYIPYGRFVSVH